MDVNTCAFNFHVIGVWPSQVYTLHLYYSLLIAIIPQEPGYSQSLCRDFVFWEGLVSYQYLQGDPFDLIP